MRKLKFKIGDFVRVKRSTINGYLEHRSAKFFLYSDGDIAFYVGKLKKVNNISRVKDIRSADYSGSNPYIYTLEGIDFMTFSSKELEVATQEELCEMNKKGILKKINTLWRKQKYYKTLDKVMKV